jgi:hypothetical protein
VGYEILACVWEDFITEIEGTKVESLPRSDTVVIGIN